MFGYVKPHVPTLQVRDYELYRAVYCGLCREMGRITGQMSRFTLSYDFCFLALLLLALADAPAETEIVRCPAHPVKKRAVLQSHPALTYTATAAACLVDGKRLDDLADETGLRRLKSFFLTPLCTSMTTHIHRLGNDTETFYHVAAQSTAQNLRSLSDLEKAKCDSAEQTAQCFGNLLSAVFSLCAAGLSPNNKTAEAILSECGLFVGRFIYLCDAMDDLTEDIQRERYNPLAHLWGEYALTDNRPSPMLREGFRLSVTAELAGLGRAIELLPSPNGSYVRILKNIVYAGMPQTVREIASPHFNHKKHNWRFSRAGYLTGSKEVFNMPEDSPAQE